MPGIAHVGVALASKRITPDIPLILLIIAAEFIDIIFIILMIFGIESIPEVGIINTSPSWSHSFLMALLWSSLAVITSWFIYGKFHPTTTNFAVNEFSIWSNRKFLISGFIGLLVFSHWILDFIASPMAAVFPTDTGKQIFPIANSVTIGLGLMSTSFGVLLIEGGAIIFGLIVYISTKIHYQTEKIILKA